MMFFGRTAERSLDGTFDLRLLAYPAQCHLELSRALHQLGRGRREYEVIWRRDKSLVQRRVYLNLFHAVSY